MRLEKIKTFILIVLVGLSLLLTFGLWTYQPKNDLLYDTSYVNEVDLGGTEETKRSIVEPNMLVFHRDGEYFSYNDPTDGQELYKDMQLWELQNLSITESNGVPVNDYQLELIFPDDIPVEMIPSLFTLESDEESLPGWSFRHVYITFNQGLSSLNIQFLSVDGRKQATAVIEDQDAYNQLWATISDPDDLTEYMLFESADTPIYLPKNELKMSKRSIAVEGIDPKEFVNALFSNPSLVSANYDEAYYTDGQRGLSVLQDGRRMEFINPIHPNYEQMNVAELLDTSIESINEHKGWTDEFKLASIDADNNSLVYRMHYGGYPVFNHGGLSIIDQKWRNHELHQYRRPLFRLNNTLGGEDITLASGSEVIAYLEEEEKFETSKIKNVQVGYHLSYSDNVSYNLTLEPSWYVNYKGQWQEIELKSDTAHDEGGTQ